MPNCNESECESTSVTAPRPLHRGEGESISVTTPRTFRHGAKRRVRPRAGSQYECLLLHSLSRDSLTIHSSGPA